MDVCDIALLWRDTQHQCDADRRYTGGGNATHHKIFGTTSPNEVGGESVPLRWRELPDLDALELRKRRAPRAQPRFRVRRRWRRVPQLIFKGLCFHTPPLARVSCLFTCLRIA
jgi:hypothetical protein